MADYVDLPLVTDADALVEPAVRYMEDAVPGLVLRPGSVETVLLEGGAQLAAEVVEQAAQVAPVIFAYLGQSLLGVGLRESTNATGTAAYAFTADAPAGLVPAGTLLAVPSPNGEPIVCETQADLVVAAGGALNVGVTAIEAGESGNGAYGACEPIDVIEGVASVTVAVPLDGGTDGESDDDYLDRLADTLTIMAPRPILPADFATFARQIPGVERALAIDLYQPSLAEGGYGDPRDGASHTPVARCCTTAITGPGGTAPSAELMETVYLAQDAAREVNFLVYVIPPTYTTIDVQATVRAFPGQSTADVKEAAEAIVRGWLDPASFGSPQTAGVNPEWALNNKVRLYEAVDYLNRAQGVHYVETVQLRKAGDAWGNIDVPLPGTAPLPVAGAITVTVLAA